MYRGKLSKIDIYIKKIGRDFNGELENQVTRKELKLTYISICVIF